MVLPNCLVVLIDVAVVDRFCGWVLIADSRQDGAEHFRGGEAVLPWYEWLMVEHGSGGIWRSC
jgi:hypothetical protein